MTTTPRLQRDAMATPDADGAAMKILESLTPGGSEFYNDPQRCAEFIREQMEAMKKTILQLKRPAVDDLIGKWENEKLGYHKYYLICLQKGDKKEMDYYAEKMYMCENHITDLKSISSAKEGEKWIDISIAPEDKQNVMIETNNIVKVLPATYDATDEKFYRFNNSIAGDRSSRYYYADVIKWQPFPEP